MKTLQQRIQELKKRANPINYSTISVDPSGNLSDTFQTDLDNRIINGYLMTWGTINSYQEMAIKGCCAKSLQERGPGSNSKYKITFLWQHDTTDPLAIFGELTEDDFGLRFRTLPLDDVASADRALKQVRSGTLNQFSAGFNYIWDKIDYDPDNDALILKEIDLMEGSIVTIASDPNTFALRSKENFDAAQLLLNDEMEDFIKTIPRKQQLELRQLITRQKSLYKIEPHEQKQDALEVVEPVNAIDYNYLLTDLKIFK